MEFTKKRLLQILTENIDEMAMEFNTDDRPDQGIQDKLKNKDTTFKKVPLPKTDNEDQTNFQELLASSRYRQVISKLRQYTGIQTKIEGLNGMQPLMASMMDAHNKIVSIERTKKTELENLAVDLVMKEMGIPEGSLQFDVKIVGMGEVDADNFNMDTDNDGQEEENEAFEVESELLDTLETLDFEKAKRRMINSIIQGASKKGHYMFHAVEDRLIEITGDENIANLYGMLMSINDTMYWQLSDEVIKQAGGAGSQNMAGKEEVDRNTDPPTIIARGINFPVLVHEIIKGVLELFAVQGRPEDDETFDETDKEDTLEKEMWDLRLGPSIWDRIRSQFPEEILIDENKVELQNYLLVEIFKLPAKKFLVFMKEVLSQSREGKNLIDLLMQGVEKLFEGEDYEDEMINFNTRLNRLSGALDDDELNNYLGGLGIEPYKED